MYFRGQLVRKVVSPVHISATCTPSASNPSHFQPLAFPAALRSVTIRETVRRSDPRTRGKGVENHASHYAAQSVQIRRRVTKRQLKGPHCLFAGTSRGHLPKERVTLGGNSSRARCVLIALTAESRSESLGTRKMSICVVWLLGFF